MPFRLKLEVIWEVKKVFWYIQNYFKFSITLIFFITNNFLKNPALGGVFANKNHFIHFHCFYCNTFLISLTIFRLKMLKELFIWDYYYSKLSAAMKKFRFFLTYFSIFDGISINQSSRSNMFPNLGKLKCCLTFYTLVG